MKFMFGESARSQSVGALATRQTTTMPLRRARGRRFRDLRFEPLEDRRLLDASAPWQNQIEPLDVNADGLITPIDALLIVNRINNIGPGDPPDLGDETPPPYYDVSGNNVITALDALLVIAALNDTKDGPQVEASVLNMVDLDGLASTDGKTADATIVGAITNPVKTVAFSVQVDNGPLVNILPLLQNDGTFLISQSILAAASTGGALHDGVRQLHFSVMDNFGHVTQHTAPLSLRRLDLFVSPLSDDLTPQVTVRTGSAMAVPDGTPIDIDVDLNNDGQYLGSELNYAFGFMFNGAATFQINPKLPQSNSLGEPYTAHIRARAFDITGTQEGADAKPVRFDTSTSDVLKDYVNFDDGKFSWNLVTTINGAGYKAYLVNMISQQWLTPGEVSKSIWQHWVTVVVPNGVIAPTALLFIDGGNNDPAPPGTINPAFIQGALLTHSVVIDLLTVPNQAQNFADEDPARARTEDEVIAYTFDHFLNDTTETEWPALLPMTKSAVKAMDMAQLFVPTIAANQHINSFVVTGGSKRGWTTWLTAAVDDRVIGIVPMIFDALNLDEQMVHHYGAYGFFSPAIEDYEDLQVFDRIMTNEGQQLGQIVDPYRYIYAGRYNIPKLLINSPGDQFFLPDSAQFYIHDLPGPTYLQYMPNTSHSLSPAAFDSVVTFYGSILTGAPLPQYSWSAPEDGSLIAHTSSTPTEVRLWQATNPDARDFRQNYTNVVYTSTLLNNLGGGYYVGDVPTPATGATAFFIEFTFPSALPGLFFKFTTEVRVKTSNPLFDWPFPIGDGIFEAPLMAGGPPPLTGSIADVNGQTLPLVMAELATANLTVSAGFAAGEDTSPQGTAGVAAVVTTLQLSTSENRQTDVDEEAVGLASALLRDATAASGVATASDPADALFGSQVELDDLFASLEELSIGRRLAFV